MTAQLVLLGSHGLQWTDLAGLFGQFLLLSMLAIGGAITTAPDMHRYVVTEHAWLSDAEFTASVALAQAAPGPNVLFVAVIGYNAAGLAGMLCTLAGSLIPSTTVALLASRWGHARRDARAVRAFSTGLAPLTIGLLFSTGWVLAAPARSSWPTLAVVVATACISYFARLGPLWLIGAGAILGASGILG